MTITEEQLVTAVKGMPARLRQVFVMAHVERRPREEIAAALHISVRRVERRMTKALRACLERLEQGAR